MSDPIRVLQFGKHFDPDTGGIETVTLNIADALLQYGIQTDVLCTEFSGQYEEIDRGYRVIRCKSDLAFGNKRLSAEYVRKGIALEPHYDCALVHVPNPLAMLAALRWRKPVMVFWHADIPQRFIRWGTTPLDRAVLRKAAVVLGPTPIHLSGSHHAGAINGRTSIIPYPFNRSQIPAATGSTDFLKRLRAFRGNRRLSISVGRLVPYKGFDVLIEAARSFGNNLCAVIVGKGPLADELASRIAAAGVGDRIMLAGALTSAELADAFAEAHIGCMPSVTAAEMYGLAQVESMAAGLPMVSTDIPRSGVPYVNKDEVTGLVVPLGNPQALANAMLKLVDDEVLWRRLRDGALREVAEVHDQSSVAERYNELIRQVCNRP